jgi:hypothetical protein
MAVLDWCHLFGNDNDDLHWKRVVSDREKFREDLLKWLEIGESTWTTYWKNVRTYRDKNVGHIEVLPLYNIPDMMFALDSVVFYYSIIVKEFKKHHYPDDLLKYHEDYLRQTKLYVEAAFNATRGFKEEVF